MLDANGYAKIDNIELGKKAKVLYGEDIRVKPEHFIDLLKNPIAEQKIRTEEDVLSARATFSDTYNAYLKDNFLMMKLKKCKIAAKLYMTTMMIIF